MYHVIFTRYVPEEPEHVCDPSPPLSPSPAAAASRIQSGEEAVALPFLVVVLVALPLSLPLPLDKEAPPPEPRSLPSPSLPILEKLRFLMADRGLPESSSSPMLRSFGSYRKGAVLSNVQRQAFRRQHRQQHTHHSFTINSSRPGQGTQKKGKARGHKVQGEVQRALLLCADGDGVV